MSIQQIHITCLGELIEAVTPAADPATGHHRDSGVYRGSCNADWPLLTSLDRLGGTTPPHTKIGLEGPILRHFVRYSRPHLATPVNEWELLVAAQHHGVPTRLLDWSYSPLIAAHFATLHDEKDMNRAVWRLDWKAMHQSFGLPDLVFLIQDLEPLFRERAFTPWTLFEEQHEAGPFACLLEPPSLDARLVAQAAAFTLCSDKSRSFDNFLNQHGISAVLTQFVIPAAKVRRIRDQLDLVGIDERRLFPDLDGVAAELRRYYS